MLKEVVEAQPPYDVSLTIVWLPMVKGDDEESAREAARMFNDSRVTQFYDPKLISSFAFVNERLSVGIL